MKSNSHKPLLTWLLLWILGTFLIGIRNDLKLMGTLSAPLDIILANLLLDLYAIPIALILWFFMRFIFNKFGKSQLLNGSNAKRNTVIIWAILYIPLFLSGFQK